MQFADGTLDSLSCGYYIISQICIYSKPLPGGHIWGINLVIRSNASLMPGGRGSIGIDGCMVLDSL